MTRRNHPAHPVGDERAQPGDDADIDLREVARVLARYRVRALLNLAGFLAAAAVGFVLWYWSGIRPIEGQVALTFRGIERHEYPSGRRFDVDDLRSPDLLRTVLSEVGRSGTDELQRLTSGITVSPVYPDNVLAVWKRQEREGIKRDPYLPSQFQIKVQPALFSEDERRRILYSIVSTFRARLKDQLESANRHGVEFLGLAASESLRRFEYWDIPRLLEAHTKVVEGHLALLVAESADFRDNEHGVAFRDLRRDLEIWSLVHLESLRAMIYGGRLVKNRALTQARLNERLAQLEVRIHSLDQEITAGKGLLEIVIRPQPLVAAPLTREDGTPLIDATAMEKLVASDYVGPLVRRLTERLGEQRDLTKEKLEVEAHLRAVADARETPPESVPAHVRQGIDDALAQLTELEQRYAALLDRYLEERTLQFVGLAVGPRVVVGGPSPRLVLAGLVFACIAAAAVWTYLQHRSARSPGALEMRAQELVGTSPDPLCPDTRSG